MTEKLAQDEDSGVNSPSPTDLADLKLRLKVWVEKKGEVVLSDWRMALLEAIDRTGSLAKAAEELGVPYRSAWQRLKESEEHLGRRLIETHSGGPDGGSSALTGTAHDLLRRYNRFSAGLAELVDGRFRDAFD